MKQHLVYLVVALCLGCLSQAQAAPLTWTLQATFDDGGTASGTFIFDADTTVFSSVDITTTAGSVLSSQHYSYADPAACGADDAGRLGDFGDTDLLRCLILDFDGVLTNSGGTVALVPGSGGTYCPSGSAERSVVGMEVHFRCAAGFVTTVPLSTFPIVTNLTEPYNFGAGLGGAFVQASSFTTDTQSYTLGAITLDLQVNSPSTVALSLFSNNGGLPGTSLENLGSQFINANGGDYDTVYPASGTTVLQPNTTYWVVVEQIGSGSTSWVSTYSTAQFSSGAVTIGNDMYYRNVGQMTWNPQPSATDAGQFAVHASDSDADGIPNGADNCPNVANTDQADIDADGRGNMCDNCRAVANNTGIAAQCNSDGDAFGNRCDADFISPVPGNGATNSQDYGYFRTRLGTVTTPPTYDVADLNCNGTVNAQDYGIFRTLLGSPPGPGAGP